MEFKHPILFFDGYCTLCNQTVDKLMRFDKQRKFRFSSLQGETAKQLLNDDMLKDVDSVVCWDQGEIRIKSEAALHVIKHLGGFWKILLIARILPLSWRNRIYDWIARNRYKWFGKRDTCRMPSPEEKALFLD